ncbi:MAG TPA: nucleoside triphosphate pyrophosphohydrolase [Chthonomonadales bacterium]|nr:nucleoside triphosphate pyrophosphohydrolase [Chthonomonadales bacterium]
MSAPAPSHPITVVGLGPAGSGGLSTAAREALLASARRFVRTARHPAAHDLRAGGMGFETFDALYDSAPDFDAVYDAIVERLLVAAQEAPVAYAVPGHPLVGEESVRRLLAAARDRDVTVHVAGSESFLDAVLSALRLSLGDGLLVLDALALDRIEPRPDLPLVLYQVYDRDIASAAKLRLMEHYPDDWCVQVVCHAGEPGAEAVVETPLHRLDRVAVDHLTAVYVPPLPGNRQRATFADLVEVMARLRGDGGCPWDREQDHVTLKRYLVEECYEAIDAIDAGNMEALCEELGDVLLQVVFHARLEEEAGRFDARDVIGGIVEKLIRRHPHVFGDLNVGGAEEVLRNWERIKRAEKGDDGRCSVLDGVPSHMPALMRAMEISRRAVKVGFEWERLDDVLAKMEEEVSELRTAIASNRAEEVFSEVGDLLFTVVNVARWVGVDAEESLRAMLRRFTTRFHRIERGAREQGRALTELTLAEMDALWEDAKRRADLR